MSNLSFNINTNTKTTLGKSNYPVKIHESGNYISKVEYNEQYDALDIIIESEDYKFQDRNFNPLKNVGSWTTPEKALAEFQSKIASYLWQFMSKEEATINADNFQDFCTKAIELLTKYAVEPKVEFALKLVYDKNFEFPKLPKGRFLSTSNLENPLSYSRWEKENKLLPEAHEVSTSTTEEELF